MKKVGILGAGESGVGAALLAIQNNYEVWVSDFGNISPNFRKELVDNNIPFEEGKHTFNKLIDAEIIVKSPGIPQNVPVVRRLRESHIPIVSEIDFASKFCDSQIVAITGSNGKTTTATLIYHLLNEGNRDVALAGNIGKSFARQLIEKPHDIYVLEVSSFQLENITSFKPNVALILNLSPDHLDRYDYSMEMYGRTKLAICSNQGPEDLFIYWAEDVWINKLLNAPIYQHLNKKRFSINSNDSVDAWLESGILKWKQSFTLSKEDIPLIGRHNILNVLAAGLAVQSFHLKEKEFRRGVKSFQAVSHRLEKVAVKQGITFINDSKATNVDAVYYALDSIRGKIIWIVGGIDKGNDYEVIESLVREKVKAMIILGEGVEKLTNAFPEISYSCANDMQETVRLGFELAKEGESVLLSPACASFDLFKNYEDRGNQFKAFVLSY